MLILIHFLGDFALQSDDMANAKKELFNPRRSFDKEPLTPRKAMARHIFIHVGLVIVGCIVLQFLHALPFSSCVWIVALYSSLHLAIDVVKTYCNETIQKTTVNQLAAFIGDQGLHILVICMITFLYAGAEWRSLIACSDALFLGEKIYLTPWGRISTIITLVICATSASGAIVQIVTKPFPHNKSDVIEEKVTSTLLNADTEEVEQKREITRVIVAPLNISRGKRIGYIERLIVMLLIFKGAYAAIGFVATAKSLVRFKSLDHREWAEYFLIGTLLSVLLGSTCGYILLAFMG